MQEWVGLLQIGGAVVLVLLGLFSGTAVEKRHYRSIEERERQLRPVAVTNTRRLPDDLQVERAWLVTGATVISVDAFKALLAGLHVPDDHAAPIAAAGDEATVG